MSRLSRLKEKAKNIFTAPAFELTPETEERMLNGLAEMIVKHRIETPAMFFLETVKPVSFYGALFIGVPIAPAFELFGIRAHDYAILFQKSENVERLLRKIEEKTRK